MPKSRVLTRTTIVAALTFGTLGAGADIAGAQRPECVRIHDAMRRWSNLQYYAADTWGQYLYYRIEYEMASAMSLDMGC